MQSRGRKQEKHSFLDERTRRDKENTEAISSVECTQTIRPERRIDIPKKNGARSGSRSPIVNHARRENRFASNDIMPRNDGGRNDRDNEPLPVRKGLDPLSTFLFVSRSLYIVAPFFTVPLNRY